MTKPLPFDQIQGAPPTLEWVAIDRLQIDDAYQRSIIEPKAQLLITRIAQKWDWRLFQPLSVARRDDGSLFVIDGQHRLSAARLRSDLPHLPCVISTYDGRDQEAATFGAMNRNRRPMNKLEIYRAELAAGEPRATLAAGLIEQAGLILAKHTNTASWAPGTIDCIGSVVRAIMQHGQAVPLNALIVMGEAWGKKRITCAGSVLGGLVSIYHEPPPGFDPDALIEALAETTGRDLLEESQNYRLIHSRSEQKMRAAILDRAAA